MTRVAAKFVPKLVNFDQKQHRINIAQEIFDSVRDDPNLLQRFIAGDESWVYGYDVETKAQLSEWKLPHEPRPKSKEDLNKITKMIFLSASRIGKKCWHKCIISAGDYFEGDKIDIHE